MSLAIRGLAALMALSLWGCGEDPERLVSETTDDEGFEMTLEARKNFLRPGEKLLVQVTVESLQGQLTSTWKDTVNLFANAGTVEPSRLTFTFIGSADTLYTGGGVETRFSDWVTYTMSTSSSTANPDRQGEVIAQFRDLEAVLKIRIIDD
jgi:hypothetical protein